MHVEDEITKLIQHYYSCSTIRARILEFMGGSSEADATAVYAVANDGLSGFSQARGSRYRRGIPAWRL